MRKTLALAWCSTLMIVTACGGDSSGPAVINLSGTFSGTISAVGFPAGTATFTLTQSGTSVTGSWVTSLGSAGTGSGNLSGTTLSITLNQTNPCAGTFTGTATVQNAGNRLSGSFSGSDCNGSGSGTFVVNRT